MHAGRSNYRLVDYVLEFPWLLVFVSHPRYEACESTSDSGIFASSLTWYCCFKTDLCDWLFILKWPTCQCRNLMVLRPTVHQVAAYWASIVVLRWVHAIVGIGLHLQGKEPAAKKVNILTVSSLASVATISIWVLPKIPGSQGQFKARPLKKEYVMTPKRSCDPW